MFSSFIARCVQGSIKYRNWIILSSVCISLFSCFYLTRHFTINTDISTLIKNDAAWQALGQQMDQAFPLRDQTILAVIKAPAQEFADQAAVELAHYLEQPHWKNTIQHVSLTSNDPFFAQHGFLFLDPATLNQTLNSLKRSKPLINALIQNPSLTGLSHILTSTLQIPLLSGQIQLSDLKPLFIQSNQTIQSILSGKKTGFSWQSLMEKPNHPNQVGQSFITVEPVLNFQAIQAGAETTNTIKQAAQQLNLAKKYGASVHLTGELPLSDDEFASIEKGMFFNTFLMITSVLALLWFALRSRKMIAAGIYTLFVGLVTTAAVGLAIVGSFNMISVAFMVLFIGLGADFMIQFAVKYREVRLKNQNISIALIKTAHALALPLTLATIAVALSFFSFLPTAYLGISELGLIAGIGILIAYFYTISLFPALSSFIQDHPTIIPRFPKFAPIDHYLAQHRRPILIATLTLIIAGLPLLTYLKFDFNPLNLKDPKSDSMATLLSLKNAPEAGIQDVTILKPSLSATKPIVKKLQTLPEVGQITTLSSFIPTKQVQKMRLIQQAAKKLLPILNQKPNAPSNDIQRANALKRLANQLQYAAEDYPGSGASEAQALSKTLIQLANATPEIRDQAEAAFERPLKLSFAHLSKLLQPSKITADTLPESIKRQWITQSGQALIQVSPKITHNQALSDIDLKNFANAVRHVDAQAIGGPISILHSAHIIIQSFYQAAIFSLISITILLWFTLRRLSDVLRTLIPLIFSGLVTLELCVILGIPLNFANIIALPLMLGVGVAFKIYFVIAWRQGKRHFLQSSLTFAVLFSAGTTVAAFGSLWLSHHPGTASMGKLLTLALFCTLIGAVLFQPILMGKPRIQEKTDSEL